MRRACELRGGRLVICGAVSSGGKASAFPAASSSEAFLWEHRPQLLSTLWLLGYEGGGGLVQTEPNESRPVHRPGHNHPGC